MLSSKKRYLISFIDDFSRKVWIYFLCEKSEAFGVFKNFKHLVEKETGEFIKCLRTDRGGEFTSFEFNNFCKDNGIRRQLTTAYTPQQNGVAEGKNRTIMNMVRSMLSEKKVPKVFWPEAVNWSVHVLNRTPTFVVKDVTPEEAWSGIKPAVDHFRVFGCMAHVHIPDNKRVKLDDKSFKCVLLGMSEESKAYRLNDPVSKRIVVSRDVVFEENESWNWGKSVEEVGLDVLEWGDDDGGQSEVDQGDVEDEGSDCEEVESAIGPSSNEPLDDSSPSSNEGRVRRQPLWMEDYVSGEGLSDQEEDVNNCIMFATADPITFQEAVKSAKWREAMDLEIGAIEKNGTWELTTLPAGAKRIGVKWVFKTKLNEHGEVDKCKASLVAKGYAQEHGIDYTEVFAPVARWDTIRMVIALAVQRGWNIFQLDVKSAFLHGELTEEVFVDQPLGYEKKGEEHKVYKLKKALYGLKKAPRAWYSRIESYFVKEGFERCSFEHALFIKSGVGGKLLIVSLYVDDLIFTGNDEGMFEKFKKSMMHEFEMTDLGKMRYFLGVDVLQSADGIYISQKKYARDILERFGMGKSNSVKNPIVPGFKLMKDEMGAKVDDTVFKQIVGSLMALWTWGFFYKKGGDEDLLGYTDSDYAGDLDDRKSTSGYVFLLGTGVVSWSSKKQPVITLSTTEAEFVATAFCACQGIWMRRVLEKLGHIKNRSTTVFCDNSSTIKLLKNPVLHGRSKHIDVRFHFLRDLTKDGVVEFVHCTTENQVADVMTKPLKLDMFLKLREQLGVCTVLEVN
ncbi:hypothetical protein M0R45_000739 [Rubus argutus]|uniref:Integrase catalytic domain-containing protein n=1 Tax=Rubus argutus TaxID=59490 RepID=A0AAW1VRZ3_RUBAR